MLDQVASVTLARRRRAGRISRRRRFRLCLERSCRDADRSAWDGRFTFDGRRTTGLGGNLTAFLTWAHNC